MGFEKKGKVGAGIDKYFEMDIIECDKCQGTTDKGTQGILTIIVQAIWSFL